MREILLCRALKPYERDHELVKLGQELSKATGVKLPPKALKEIYYRSLIKYENEPFKTIEQLREEVGDEVERSVLHGWFARGLKHFDRRSTFAVQ